MFGNVGMYKCMHIYADAETTSLVLFIRFSIVLHCIVQHIILYIILLSLQGRSGWSTRYTLLLMLLHACICMHMHAKGLVTFCHAAAAASASLLPSYHYHHIITTFTALHAYNIYVVLRRKGGWVSLPPHPS